jgi:AraC-like DNA-binding protein
MESTEYRVNDVVQETEHHSLTADQILKHAGIDSDLHFLEETHPDHVSFQDRPEEVIHLMPHMRFKSEHQLIEYKVSDEDQKTKHRKLTAKQILEHAGFDPKTHYLSEIHPEHVSFEGKPDEEICMHQHMKFIAVSIEPTPVSSHHNG